MYAMRSGSSPSTNFPLVLPTPDGGVIATATLDANAPARFHSSTVSAFATVVEGSLIGINPYGQPGVEAYKRHMNAYLRATGS